MSATVNAPTALRVGREAIAGYLAAQQAAAAAADASAARADRLQADADAAQASAAVVSIGQALTLSGVSRFYATFAAAQADLAAIANQGVVMVFADEGHSGDATIYRKVSGALVLQADLTAQVAGPFVAQVAALTARLAADEARIPPVAARTLAKLKSDYNATTAYGALDDATVTYVLAAYGQSTMAGEDTDTTQPAITITPVYPGYVKTPVTASQAVARSPGPNTITNFTDLYEFNTSGGGFLQTETPLSGMANTFAKEFLAATGRTPRVIAFTAAVPGQNYQQLKKGSPGYEAFLQNLTDIMALELAAGRRVIVPAIVWGQGPADTLATTPIATYARNMDQLQRHLQDDIQAITAQNEGVQLVIAQTGSSRYSTTLTELESDVGNYPSIAQLRAAERNPRIRLAGPDYFLARQSPAGSLHYNPAGQLGLGTMVGRALVRDLMGGGWTPTRWNDDETQWIDSTTLQLGYTVPDIHTGTGTPDYAHGSLVLDTSNAIVNSAGLGNGLGFVLTDLGGGRFGGGSHVVPIVSVSVYNPGLTQARFLRIKFAYRPANTCRLRYGCDQTPPTGVYNATITNAGSGGADGTYPLTVSGGSPTDGAAQGNFVVYGGVVTAVNITVSGVYPSGTPTLSLTGCPGLTGATATAVMGLILGDGPRYGARGCVRDANGIVTASGDTVYSWAAAQTQTLPPAPAPQPNILRNGRGRVFQRTPANLANGSYGLDRWYALQSGAGSSVQAGQYTDATYGPVMEWLQNNAGTQRIAALQVIPAEDVSPLLGSAVTLSGLIGRTDGVGSLRWAVLGYVGTPPKAIVADWTNGTFTPNAFFINDANLSVLWSDNLTGITTTGLQAIPASLINIPNTAGLSLIVMAWTQTLMAGPVGGVAYRLRGAFKLERGLGATDWENRPIADEIADCERFYGSMTVQAINGSIYVPFRRKLYKAPTVAIASHSGSGTPAVVGTPTQDGFALSDTASETVTFTWSAEV